MSASPESPTPLAKRVKELVAREQREVLEACEPVLEFVALDEHGVVQLRIPGVIGCCPASVLPWVLSLEQVIKAEVPEVQLVEVVP